MSSEGTEPTSLPSRLLEISSSLLIPRVDVGMKSLPPIAIYLQSDTRRWELLKSAGQAFSPLVLSSHPRVWIDEKDLHHLPEAIQRSLSPEKRMQSLRVEALAVMSKLFEDPNPANIKRSTQIVGSLVYVMTREPTTFGFLAKLSSHDPYTVQHSVGTAVNCLMLARKLGITDERELEEVGIAGLLHDIGKTKVRPEIINKPGPLSPEEWMEMRKHSDEGYKIVEDCADLSERTKRAILEHHEDLDGKGYPQGVPSQQTHLFSRIVGLCDIFNALTTQRSYSNARTPFEAFALIREKMSHKVDPLLLRELILIYGGQPT